MEIIASNFNTQLEIYSGTGLAVVKAFGKGCNMEQYSIVILIFVNADKLWVLQYNQSIQVKFNFIWTCKCKFCREAEQVKNLSSSQYCNDYHYISMTQCLVFTYVALYNIDPQLELCIPWNFSMFAIPKQYYS